MRIYQFDDYRHFIRFRIEALDQEGRGVLSRVARAMKVKQSYLSQILSGTKNLSHQQAYEIGKYFGLDRLEQRYLYELINLDKATDSEFKTSVRREMDLIKVEASRKSGEPQNDQFLDEQSQIIFYSSWTYSAVQLLTGLPGGQTPDQIASRLALELKTVKSVLSFLVKNGLCATDGIKYFSAKKSTNLPKHSPLRGRHQTNWRIKALDHLPKRKDEDLFFTASIRLDEKSFEQVKKALEIAIAEARRAIDEAEDTTVACLNIDWFKF